MMFQNQFDYRFDGVLAINNPLIAFLKQDATLDKTIPKRVELHLINDVPGIIQVEVEDSINLRRENRYYKVIFRLTIQDMYIRYHTFELSVCPEAVTIHNPLVRAKDTTDPTRWTPVFKQIVNHGDFTRVGDLSFQLRFID